MLKFTGKTLVTLVNFATINPSVTKLGSQIHARPSCYMMLSRNGHMLRTFEVI